MTEATLQVQKLQGAKLPRPDSLINFTSRGQKPLALIRTMGC